MWKKWTTVRNGDNYFVNYYICYLCADTIHCHPWLFTDDDNNDDDEVEVSNDDDSDEDGETVLSWLWFSSRTILSNDNLHLVSFPRKSCTVEDEDDDGKKVDVFLCFALRLLFSLMFFFIHADGADISLGVQDSDLDDSESEDEQPQENAGKVPMNLWVLIICLTHIPHILLILVHLSVGDDDDDDGDDDEDDGGNHDDDDDDDDWWWWWRWWWRWWRW